MRLLTWSAALVGLSVAGPLLARPVMVDSAAGTAGRAAIAIARQTGTSIVIADAPIASRRVPPIRGQMEAEEAARRLAQAAGGRAVRAGSAGWRIVSIPKPPQNRNEPRRRQHPAAVSAPPPAPVQPLEPAEIVVSASKQDAMLSQFAGQVSVIEGEDLSRGGIGGTERISERIATVSSTHLGSGRNKLFIRGIADSSFTGPTQATVGQYLGDLRLSYNAPDPDLRLSDLERVEVLEGPQGTLYGAGSLGGIIRLVPNAPELGVVAGAAQIGGSLTQHGAGGVDATAMTNLPLLGDSTALRMTLDAATQGGYIDKPLLGMENVNRTEILGGRAAVRVELAPDWTVDLIGVAQTIEADDSQYADRDGRSLVSSSPVVEGSKADYLHGQFVVSGWIGDIRLRSTTGIASQDLRERYDATLAEGEPRLFVQTNNTEMFANETRIWQPLTGRIGWLAGISYTHNVTRLSRSLEDEVAIQPTPGVTNPVDEGALYGEVRLVLRKDLIASAGGRLSHSVLGGVDRAYLITASGNYDEQWWGSRSTTAFLPSASLLARLGEKDSFYVRYQESFRPGGRAIFGPFVQRFFDDHTATFELGARHGQSGSDTFDLAASISYTRWTDIQADFIDSDGFPSTANVGDGHVWSASLSGGVTLAPGLRVEGGVVFNDSKIDRSDLARILRMAVLYDLSTDTIEAIEAQLALTQVPNIARFSGRLGFDYRRPLGSRLELSARGWASYVGRSRLGVGEYLGDLQGDYLDSGATVRIGSATQGLTLSVTNLADVKGNRFALGTPFAVSREQVTPLRPRTIRLGFDAAF
ncbi:MAG: TonB-dependent receptor [Sphingomonadales bacterium 32-64-17]|nr:MAG: TonB-dependent receptor [Sphingomonadales bacterium 32-64-17]